MKSSAVTAGQQATATQYNNLRKDAAAAAALLATEQSSPNMTVQVEAGKVYLAGTKIEYAGGNSGTFTAPVSNPRIDLLYLNSSGSLVILQGTEAGSPTAPTYPDNALPICEVYLRTGSTQIRDTDQGSHAYISKDVRAFIGSPASNTRTFVAEEALTAGQLVGICNYTPTNRVSRAARVSTTATIDHTPGSAVEQADSAVPIGGDKWVFLTEASNEILRAVVGEYSPSAKTISVGVSAQATADLASYWAVCKLDTDKFVVFYTEDASTTIIKYRVATVSGTTITFGSAATAATGGTAINKISCDGTGTDKGILYFACSTVNQSKLKAFTCSGTTLTFGSDTAIGTVIDNTPSEAKVKKIDTDKFMLVTGEGYSQVGTISGTTITLGTEAEYAPILSYPDQKYLDIAVLTTTLVVVKFKNNSHIPFYAAGTISGTTVTWGAIYNTTSGGSQYQHVIAPDPTSTSAFIVASMNGTTIMKYTISGTTISEVGNIVTGLTNYDFLLPLSNATIGFKVNGTTATVFAFGMAAGYIGIAQESASRGANIKVMLRGNVDATQSSQIQGLETTYLVPISATEAIIKN